MEPMRFNVKSLDGDVVADLDRTIPPIEGEVVVVFDYPEVVRYVVERLERRTDIVPRDPIEPVRVVLRRLEVIERSVRAHRSIGVDMATDIIARLEETAEFARGYITERLSLDICHSDFVAMCNGAGLTCDVSKFDIMQFRGIPMSVGKAGEDWNAYSAFEGFNPDMCVLYVTFPGGGPMVMDPRFLDLTQRVADGKMTQDEAIGDACLHAQLSTPVNPAILHAIKNSISLVAEGIMPPYDAAQDLVQVTSASQAARVQELWTLHNEREAAPQDLSSPYFRLG